MHTKINFVSLITVLGLLSLPAIGMEPDSITITNADNNVTVDKIPFADIKANRVLNDVYEEQGRGPEIAIGDNQVAPLRAIRPYLADERRIANGSQNRLHIAFDNKSIAELAIILNAAQLFQTDHISNTASKILATKLHSTEHLQKILQRDSISALDLTPDTANLVAQNMNARTLFWLLQEQRHKGGLKKAQNIRSEENEYIESLCWNSNSTMLATSLFRKPIIRLWNIDTQPVCYSLPGHTGPTHSISLSHDDSILASGSYDKTIRLWDIQTRQPIGSPLIGHYQKVYSVNWGPKNRMLASGSKDKTVRIWNIQNENDINQSVLKGHSYSVRSVIWNPDGTLLAAADDYPSMKIWDVVYNKAISTIEISLPQTIISWNPKHSIVAYSLLRKIQLLDTKTGKSLGSLEINTQSSSNSYVPGSTHWSPDGNYLAGGSFHDSTVRIWDLKTKKQIGNPLKNNDRIRSIRWSPDGSVIAAGSDNGLQLWNIIDKKSSLLPYFKNNANSLELKALLEYCAERKLTDQPYEYDTYPGIERIKAKLPHELQELIFPAPSWWQQLSNPELLSLLTEYGISLAQ